MAINPTGGIELLATGIPGFDLVSMGGLPLGRVTMVSGTAGAGKTVFATQFLIEGIRQAGDACVFVTLEEPPADIRASMLSFGWDIARFEAEGQWIFIDGSPQEYEMPIGDYDLGGLLARIRAATGKVGAKRLAIDAISALFARFPDQARIRSELFKISRAIRGMGVTSMMTSERAPEETEISRYQVEEFVADNVIVLRNALEAELRRRTVEILKMRGVPHRRGEFPFVMIHGRGIEVLPLSAILLQHRSSMQRTASGNAELDKLCGGGLFRNSITLVPGPTGVGKTLLATGFAAAAAAAGERCLFLGFEESREQLLRNAAGWGYDLQQMEAEGHLQVISEYPEASSLEDRLISIRDMIGQFRPQRVVLDTVTALHRLASDKTFRDFTLGLTSLLKREQITGLFTADVGTGIGGEVVGAPLSRDYLSGIADSIIQLRYVEIGSRIYRGLTVLKLRGSSHETEIREFSIDGRGLHIGPAFQQTQGVLIGSGRPVVAPADDRDGALNAVLMG